MTIFPSIESVLILKDLELRTSFVSRIPRYKRGSFYGTIIFHHSIANYFPDTVKLSPKSLLVGTELTLYICLAGIVQSEFLPW